MASHQRDTRGHFHSNAAPSTSANLPGGFPNIQANPHVADSASASDGEVEGFLAETGPHDVTHLIDPESPVRQTPDIAA
jgi:hypothetical protein